MYFLDKSKEELIDYSSFADAGDCVVSHTKDRNVSVGKYIKIMKDTDEVIFVNNKNTENIWIGNGLVYEVPILINI